MADGQQVEGVDYAWSRPNISQLASLGKVFACRYGGPGTSGKHLTASEAQTLSAAGISIVANAEGAADGLLGGWNAGVSWASSAEIHFRNCGMPPDRPIYLSVDFDVTSAQWPTVANALRGAASVLGAARVGVYGGRRAIEWARRDGVARWYWQTYAWSSGVWVPGNHIEQYLNGVTIAGTGSVDLDRALTSDYGQWKVGDNDMGDYGALGEPTNVADYNRDYPDSMIADVFAALVRGDTGWGTADGHGADGWALYKRLDAIKSAVATPEIDYDLLAEKVAALMPKPATPEEIAKAVVTETARELTD